MKKIKNYIKALVCLVVLGMAVSSVSAQEYVMKVWKGATATHSIPTADVDSVTFVSSISMIDFTVPASLPLMIYDEEQLTPTPIPADANDLSFSYESDNPEVVTVDLAGNVKAIAIGTAKITVSHGAIEKEINVTVADFSDIAEWSDTTDSQWGEGDPGMWWAQAPNILNTWNEVFWHSDPVKPLPASVTVDMKTSKRIASFDYGTTKSGGGNDAIPLVMIIEVSDDGNTWTKVVDLSACPTGRTGFHILSIDVPVWARYYKATVSAVLGGYPFLQLGYLAPTDIVAH
jgi:hypothetical protein